MKSTKNVVELTNCADISVKLHFQVENRSRVFWTRCRELQRMAWPLTIYRNAVICVEVRLKMHSSFLQLKKFRQYAG